MSVVEWMALAGLLVQLIGMGVGAFWIVGSVRSTSSTLGITIEHLTKTLNRLEETMKSVEQKQVEQEIRLRVIEASRASE